MFDLIPPQNSYNILITINFPGAALRRSTSTREIILNTQTSDM